MRILCTIFMVLMGGVSMYACDICGSNSGGGQLGILPNYQRHFVGVRYRFSSFYSLHAGSDSKFASDTFQTAELFARFVAHPNVQIFVSAPFLSTQHWEGNLAQKVQGIGDVSLLATYLLLNTTDSLAHTCKHALQVGGGVKLPTGAYQLVQNKHTLPVGIQPGSGSVDALANVLYTLRYRKVGLNIDANYRYTTTNPDLYKQGNRVSGTARIFYWRSVKNTTILPHVGISLENATADTKPHGNK